MNFLNEVAGEHPQAISFASGRPAEQFLDVAGWQAGAEAFLLSDAARTGVDLLQARWLQAQYGPMAGTIGRARGAATETR